MSKNNNKVKNSELDFVSPIVETLTPIVEEGMKLIATLIQFLLKKLFQYVEVHFFNRYQVAPIKARALKSKKTSDLSNTLGFSVNHNTPFKASELNTRKHTAIIGSTGSGKTVCTYLLIEHALKKGMPVIYFDPKASTENIKTFKRICEANNKKLYVFSDIEGHKTSFNPLLGGNLGDISDKIINALEWSEPFYKNESIEALDDVLMKLPRFGGRFKGFSFHPVA